jgi:transposase
MKKYIVRFTEEEREKIKGIISRGKAAAYKIRHANILLKADTDGANWQDKDIASAFGTHENTVAKIRQRFVEQGLEAALERKKQDCPSKLPKFDGAGEARLIAISCSKPPEGYNHWTLQLLADKAVEMEIVDTVSYETIRRTLKKTSLSRI